jgi:hypothetical protein
MRRRSMGSRRRRSTCRSKIRSRRRRHRSRRRSMRRRRGEGGEGIGGHYIIKRLKLSCFQ